MNSEELTRQIEEIAALRLRARRWRLAAMGVSVVGTMLCLLILRNSALQLVQPGPARDEFVGQLQSQLGEQVVPEARALTVQTFDRLVPRVRREIVALQPRVPEVAERFQAELELLRDNTLVRAQRPLEASLNNVLRSREEQLRSLFPGLTEERVGVLLDQLADEAEEHLANVVTPVILPYQHTLTSIMDDLEQIRVSEGPALAGNAPEWEVTFLCLNLLKEELNNLDTDRLRLAMNPEPGKESTR